MTNLQKPLTDKEPLDPEHVFELVSCPQIKIVDVKAYQRGEIALEELFLRIEDTVTGKKLTLEEARWCVAFGRALGFLK